MPSRNRIKIYAPETFYHVYNRGVNKTDIFLQQDDYRVFLNLLKRHLSKEVSKDRFGRPYKNFYNNLELLTFCLLPNHFHLFFYQVQPDAITQIMKSISGAYVAYFNEKYGRVGSLFQDIFKASNIDNESYLLHISRYIHLNALDAGYSWDDYPFSSFGYFTGKFKSDWLKPERILQIHNDLNEPYEQFVADYKGYKDTLDEIKLQLAG